MAIVEAVAIVIHVILALTVAGLVLLHSGKGGGLSDVFGGGMSTSSLGGSTVVEREPRPSHRRRVCPLWHQQRGPDLRLGSGLAVQSRPVRRSGGIGRRARLRA